MFTCTHVCEGCAGVRPLASLPHSGAQRERGGICPFPAPSRGDCSLQPDPSSRFNRDTVVGGSGCRPGGEPLTPPPRGSRRPCAGGSAPGCALIQPHIGSVHVRSSGPPPSSNFQAVGGWGSPARAVASRNTHWQQPEPSASSENRCSAFSKVKTRAKEDPVLVGRHAPAQGPRSEQQMRPRCTGTSGGSSQGLRKLGKRVRKSEGSRRIGSNHHHR